MLHYHNEYNRIYDEIYNERIKPYQECLRKLAKEGKTKSLKWVLENEVRTSRQALMNRLFLESNGKAVYDVKFNDTEKYLGKEIKEAYEENPEHFDAYACFC